LGFALTVVPTSKVLHLKSAATALPDGKIIAHLPSLDDDHPFRDVLPTPDHEINGAHVVNPQSHATASSTHPRPPVRHTSYISILHTKH
jgi:hypothetical protein